MQKQLRVLLLHGKFQDGEVFSARLKTAKKKLRRAVEPDFAVSFIAIDAPFELPLRDGDEIAMRSWYDGSSADDVDRTVKYISDQVKAPLDGVLCFSQGTCVLVEMLMRKIEICASLKFVVCAGGLLPSSALAALPVFDIPSLHYMSADDAVVDVKKSEALARCFESARLVYHRKRHVFPQTAEHTAALCAFVKETLR